MVDWRGTTKRTLKGRRVTTDPPEAKPLTAPLKPVCAWTPAELDLVLRQRQRRVREA